MLIAQLLTAVYWIDEALQAGLRAKGWPPVSRMHSLVLVNVAAGVQRASILARNLGVTRQAMSQTLADMEERQLIKLVPDPDDRRAQLVTFEPQSSALNQDAIGILDLVDTILASRMGARHFQALREAMACDWGPPPADIIAAASGAPLPPPKKRGRPPGIKKAAGAID